MIDYDGRTFHPMRNSPGGEVDDDTVFHYRQEGSAVWGTYRGGRIVLGTLVAAVNDDASLDMRYQHLNADGTFRCGECRSVPEVLDDGRLRLHESWRWTAGATGSGESVIEERRCRSGPPDLVGA